MTMVMACLLWWWWWLVIRVGISYMFGAVGSVLGAALAFWHSQATDSLPRETARKVMAAVAATYVGGTVNFFQVG